MFGQIALFQLRYQLRRWSTYIVLAIVLALGYLTPILAGMDEAVKLVNSPRAIADVLGSGPAIICIAVMIIGLIPLRDADNQMDELIRTSPVSGVVYLLGKFAGALLLAVSLTLALAIAAEIGTRLSWLAPSVIGPFRWQPYATALIVFALPNLLIVGTILFAIAGLTRTQIAVWGALIVLSGLNMAGETLANELRWRWIAAPADPFGVAALKVQTVYWTSFERNTNLVPVEGLIVWNRLIWCAIAAALLALCVVRFRRTVKTGTTARPSASRAAMPVAFRRPVAMGTGAGLIVQLVVRTRHELRAILRSWTFWILTLLGTGLCWGVLAMLGRLYDTPVLPVTHTVAEVVASVSKSIALTIIVIFGAEQVWRDRKVKIADIVGATPVSNFVLVGGNLIALAMALTLVLGACMATGIAFQVVGGVTNIEIGTYLGMLFVLVGSSAMILGVLSLFVQILINQKLLGQLAFGGLMIGVPIVLAKLQVSDPLLIYSSHSAVPLSDLNGLGHGLAAASWFLAYWGSVALLLIVVIGALWARSARTSIVARILAVPRLLTRPVIAMGLLALAATAASGGYVYWNTHILNDSETASTEERLRIDFERAFGRYELLPQPRITAIEMAVDLVPEQRAFRSHGHYTLVNRTAAAIETVHVKFAYGLTVEKVELSAKDTLIEANRRFNHFVFKLAVPLAPKEARTLSFVLSDASKGFTNGDNVSHVVGNGTFLNSTILGPFIGVPRQDFLQNNNRRRANGLVYLAQLPNWSRDARLRRNYIRGDADFVRFGLTVSTSPDQTALAPGYLQREWAENGRRFFRYQMEKPILNFWTLVSARYATVTDKWNNVEIAVYHHPGHGANVERMIESAKASLAYYSENFGPYPYRRLRIVEFPKYFGLFAQAFPGTVPYSEGLGFIADNRDPSRIDHVWFVTAHEIGHQWWAHQVIGADLPGATLLSETLSEYAALMVMERRYGVDRMRLFLKHELDTYLKGHAASHQEDPLVTVWRHESYVHYQKGALAMYALKDAIGETAVNRALAALIRKHAYKSNPYPTAADLIRLLRSEAKPEHQQLITDLFEKIALWDLGVVSANVNPTDDGKWRVQVEIAAKKLYAKPNGEETEVPLEQPIDIGLFAADPAAASFRAPDVILLEKRQIKSGKQTIDFVVDRKPAFVGIDPYIKLIQRKTDRNIAAVDAGGWRYADAQPDPTWIDPDTGLRCRKAGIANVCTDH
jgi:ABC-2 type transport system permease protein